MDDKAFKRELYFSKTSCSTTFLNAWHASHHQSPRSEESSNHAAFLHVSFQHLLANLLLFAVLGGMLECRYGTLRMLVVAVLSTLGAAFFAGAFEDQCTQVRGWRKNCTTLFADWQFASGMCL